MPVYAPDLTCEEKLTGLFMIVGHEITHGFDKDGARYDKVALNAFRASKTYNPIHTKTGPPAQPGSCLFYDTAFVMYFPPFQLLHSGGYVALEQRAADPQFVILKSLVKMPVQDPSSCPSSA